MDCKEIDLTNNESVQQLFILGLIHGIASGFGGGRRYYDTYSARNVYYNILTKMGALATCNPILVCIEIFKFRSTKFCFAEKFGSSQVTQKYNTIEFLKVVARNYTANFNFNYLKGIINIKLSDVEVKEILMETANFLFYSAYNTGYYGNSPVFTTTEVKELLNKTIKNGTKITGESMCGLFEVVKNIKTDVTNSTDINEFTGIYDTIKQIKGYTIWVRSKLIGLLLEYGVNDPNRIDKIKDLLKKETSKRVWAEFKETVFNEIHVVTNEWDYKTRKYTTHVKTEDMQAILEFMEFVDKKPKMNYTPYYGNQMTKRVIRCLKTDSNGKLEWKTEEITEIKPEVKKDEGEKE